uniref:carbonic anhydrase n=1 Tax=Lygus hesperus TaxID=30085 RepID=A0A0A9YHH4_LYGHE
MMVVLTLIGFMALFVRKTSGGHGVDFEYSPGYKALVPCQWATEYPTCGGSHQSPVDLPTCAKVVCQPPLRFTNLLGEPEQVELIHMLHTPLVKYHMLEPVKVHGGPLCGSYVFDHYNVRWGEDAKKGSEHTLGGKSYAGELQLVFYKNTTNGFHDAINITDGVVIFSVWLEEVRSPDNSYFDELLGMMDYITKPWSYTDLCERIPIKYYLPQDRQRYYTYKGSLTYPPCVETVIWVIFMETIPFSHYQFIKLRRMIGVRGSISTNIRPVQQNKLEILKVHTPPACIGE